MEELNMKDMQMKGLRDKITASLGAIEKSKRPEVEMNDIQLKLKEFQIAFDAANIELRQCPPESKEQWKNTLRTHKNNLRELKNEFEWKKQQVDREQLMGDHKTSDAVDFTTADGLMKHGMDVQDKSTKSLQRTINVIEEAKTVGNETVTKLNEQTEKIEGMYDKLESIESTLARSTAIIKRMARKMATDKYIWVMVFLVMAAIVIIIVLQKINDNSSSSTASSSSTGSGR